MAFDSDDEDPPASNFSLGSENLKALDDYIQGRFNNESTTPQRKTVQQLLALKTLGLSSEDTRNTSSRYDLLLERKQSLMTTPQLSQPLTNATDKSGRFLRATLSLAELIDPESLHAQYTRHGPKDLYTPLLKLSNSLEGVKKVYPPFSTVSSLYLRGMITRFAQTIKILDRIVPHTCLALDPNKFKNDQHRECFEEVLMSAKTILVDEISSLHLIFNAGSLRKQTNAFEASILQEHNKRTRDFPIIAERGVNGQAAIKTEGDQFSPSRFEYITKAQIQTTQENHCRALVKRCRDLNPKFPQLQTQIPKHKKRRFSYPHNNYNNNHKRQKHNSHKSGRGRGRGKNNKGNNNRSKHNRSNNNSQNSSQTSNSQTSVKTEGGG